MKLPWYMRQQPTVAVIAGLGGFFFVVNLTSAPALDDHGSAYPVVEISC